MSDPQIQHQAPISTDHSEVLEPDEQDSVDYRTRAIVAVLMLGILGYFAWMAYNMPLGSATDPGPGFFPLIVALVGCASSTLLLVESVMRLRSQDENGTVQKLLPETQLFVLYLVLYGALIPFLGLYLSSILFCVATIRTVGKISNLKSLIYGTIIGAIVSVLAIEVLSIRIQPWPGL